MTSSLNIRSNSTFIQIVILVLLTLSSYATKVYAVPLEHTPESPQKKLEEQLKDFPWLTAIQRAYKLPPDETLRSIPLPRIKEMNAYQRRMNTKKSFVNFFYWDRGKLVSSSVTSHASFRNTCSVEELILRVTELNRSDLHIQETLKKIRVSGDWSIERSSSTDKKITAIQKQLKSMGYPLSVEKHTTERTSITLTGIPSYHPLPIIPKAEGVYLYSDVLGKKPTRISHSTHWGAIVLLLENCTHVPVIEKSTKLADIPQQMTIQVMKSALLKPGEADTPAGAIKLDLILENLSSQTGLTLERERKKSTVWEITLDMSKSLSR